MDDDDRVQKYVAPTCVEIEKMSSVCERQY